MEYLDSLIREKEIKSGIVTPLKSAIYRVFEAVSGENWSEIELANINLDSYIEKFKTKATNINDETTFTSYRSRISRAIKWYKYYSEDPNWKPRPRLRARNNATSIMDKQTNNEVNDGFMKYPFPLKNGTLASLYLPKELRKNDAQRLMSFISSLITEE